MTIAAAEQSNKKILRRIRALMAKTVENGCTQDEAEAAAATVARLMIRYNLNMQQVSEAGGQTEQYVRTDMTLACGNGPYVLQHRRLVYVLAKEHFCKSINYLNTNRVCIVGQESNAAVVIELYQHLVQAQVAFSEAAYRAEDARRYIAGQRKLEVQTWRRDFLLGFTNGLQERFEIERAQAAQHGIHEDSDEAPTEGAGFVMLPAASDEDVSAAQVTALVVVKDKELAEATKKFFPKLVKGTPITYRSTAARDQGHAAAQRVDIHRNTKIG